MCASAAIDMMRAMLTGDEVFFRIVVIVAIGYGRGRTMRLQVGNGAIGS